MDFIMGESFCREIIDRMKILLTDLVREKEEATWEKRRQILNMHLDGIHLVLGTEALTELLGAAEDELGAEGLDLSGLVKENVIRD